MRLEKILPSITWIKNYKLKYLYFDLIASINLAVSMIPKGMAYALVAGLPPIYGLYASFIAPLIGILFGSNKLLFTGPVGVMTVLVYTSLSKFAEPQTPEYISMAATLALMVGIIMLFLGLFRLTFILKLISHSVLIGFVNAAVIVIIMTQLKYILGIHYSSEEFLITMFVEFIKELPNLKLLPLIFSIITILTIYIFHKYFKRIQEAIVLLILIIVFTIAVATFNLEEKGIEVVGKLPQGIPSPSLPSVDAELLSSLALAALVISIVGMSETYSISKIIAYYTKQRVNFNQEFIGQGLANIFTSFFKGYPVCGSFSGTSVNWGSGAKTGFSIIFFSIFTLLTITILTPLFYYVPRFILAIIVILAVIKLLKPKQLLELYKINKYDGIVAMVTFIISLTVSLDYGIFAGIILSLALYVWRTMHIKLYLILKDKSTGLFIPVSVESPPSNCHQILMIKPEGPLIYMNAEDFRDKLFEVVNKCKNLRKIIIDMNAVYHIDAAGVDILKEILEELHVRGIDLILIHLDPEVKKVIKKSGIEKEIKIFERKSEAIRYAIKDVNQNICKKCKNKLFNECPS